MDLFNKFIKKSVFIMRFAGSGCNGCSIETQACFTPTFDAGKHGVNIVFNPNHADVLLITGCINKDNKELLKNVYDEMPSPKSVVAVGACACTGGIFKNIENIGGGADNIIPVDLYIKGCSPHPRQIIEGIIMAAEAMGTEVKNEL